MLKRIILTILLWVLAWATWGVVRLPMLAQGIGGNAGIGGTAGIGGGVPAVIPSIAGHVNGSGSATAGQNTTNATLLVCFSMIDGTTPGNCSSTLNAVGAWTSLSTYSSASEALKIEYICSPATGASDAFSGSVTSSAWYFYFWATNTKGSGCYDSTIPSGNGHINGAGGTATVQPGTTGTLSQTNELCVTGGLSTAANFPSSIDSGFSIVDTQSTFDPGSGWGYVIPSVTTALNPTITFSSTSGTLGAAIACFEHP